MSSNKVLPYEYQPLSDPSKSIRLLTLLQDPSNVPLRCELHETSFPSEHNYTALSYVWGPPDARCQILVNNGLLEIRKNLQAFLSQLRSRLSQGQTLTLWADAICIDQVSTLEKNLQVRMMGEIYSNAGDVIAWLGESERIERLFSSLEDYQTTLTRLASEEKISSDRSRQKRATRMQAFVEYPEFGPDLLAFYGVEYFHRTWIIQELILAPSLALICGSSCLSHNGLITLFNHLRFQRVMTGRNEVDVILGHYLDSKIEMSHVSDDQFTLNQLITHYAYTECSDPHDKIYAFIGAARDLRSNFIVDYEKPLQLLVVETILDDIHGRDLADYFGITYLLHASDFDSSHLYSFDTFAQKVVWASHYVKLCQETLPHSLLSRRLAIKPQLVGKVASVDSFLASVNHTRASAVRFRNDAPPACRIINGETVLEHDLIFQSLSLCFVYRWCDPHIKLVAMGIAPDSEISKSTSAVWEHIQAIYTEGGTLGAEKSIDISTNSGLQAAIHDWNSYWNSSIVETLDLSIPVSNFLVMLQADFPKFMTQGGIAFWT